MLNTTKQCTKCEQIKDISEYGYYKDRGTYKTRCKTCEKIRVKEYYKNNPDKKTKAQRKHLKKKYNESIGIFEVKIDTSKERFKKNLLYRENNILSKKECISCEETKELSLFHKAKCNSDGSRNICKICTKRIRKEKYSYPYTNKRREQNRNYYYNNIDRIKEHRDNNKEYFMSYNKEYRQSYHGRMVALNLGHKYRKKKRRTSDGTIPQHVRYPLVGELKELLDRQGHKCNDCGTHISREKKNIELDHHFPVSKDGTHSIDNVVWLCKQCNQTKRAKMPDTLMLVW